MDTISPQQAEQVYREADCLYTQTEIETAIAEMAAAITQRLHSSNPLVLCVMTGALVPMGQLLTHLDFPLQIDYVHATRYQGETQGKALQWLVRPQHSLTDRVVLVVDDILDEGITLQAILADLQAQGASAVYTAVLVEKEHTRKADIQADFIGVKVPDRYVFGYGMDYKDYLRNTPGIYAVRGL
ncbi:MAG: hypoxanthine-guanine phosphoribosyltransferase [Thiohalomonadaceae bacterium]